jgi:hypothetical protein
MPASRFRKRAAYVARVLPLTRAWGRTNGSQWNSARPGLPNHDGKHQRNADKRGSSSRSLWHGPLRVPCPLSNADADWGSRRCTGHRLELSLESQLEGQTLDAFAGPPGTQGELEVLSYGSVVPDECPSHKLNKETSFEI